MGKNILIDYRIYNTDKYLGNSFPPLIYEYLKKESDHNVYSLSSKNIPNIDLLFIINGGSHWTYRDLKFNNFHLKQLIIWIYPKFEKYLIWLGYFFGLHKLKFYQRHLFRNKSYEKHVDAIIKKNPNIKIIHRLDGSYQTICKVYGYDKTIKYINDKSDLTIHQSYYSKNLWEKGFNTIFGKTVKLNPKKSIVINNGINTKIFKPNKNKLKSRVLWKILHVSASSNPKKGLYKLLELAFCLKNNKDIQFYLIGKQILDPVCGDDIKHFDNVNYIGNKIDREKIAEIYRNCDILFFPSAEDCSPNVILEAMASGLPILTIDSGGIKELIYKDHNLKGGIFTDTNNPVLSLDFLIKNYKEYHNNALEIIKRYHSNENSLMKYFDSINSLLNSDVKKN